MGAFNSPRIIVLILIIINCVESRSVEVKDDQVTLKSSESVDLGHEETRTIEEVNVPEGKLSDTAAEGIRRFDAEIEDPEKVLGVDEKSENDVGMRGISIENEPVVEIVEPEKGKVVGNPVERTGDGKEGSEVSEGGFSRRIPELIPVKVDQVDPYEINHDMEDIGRKSLTVGDEEEEEGEEIRSERSSEANGDEGKEGSLVQKWREAAVSLQSQIKNFTFLENLKGEGVEVLPEIPRFTEGQLLDALKTISIKKSSESGVSYIGDGNGTGLNESQLEIVKYAEGLVTQKERQTFAENMFECIKGLSFLNCVRIFVWPIIADRVPEAIMQSFPTLPIEVSLSDLLPGGQEKPKSIRASGGTGGPQQRLITPELVVSNILREALDANPIEEDVQTFIDPKNETLSKLLTPGQLNILKMAERFLPKSARREYSDRMYSCVRRFEYFSCVKYFAWPMVKQHFPALPEFPDYESWYPSTVSLYPGYPIVPFPDLSDNDGQLPEVIAADAVKNRTPRPETLIVELLKNTVSQQPRQPAVSAISALPNTEYLTAEQLASLQLAEQLVPPPYRAEFITKAVQCIREYNYLICTKYSIWPVLKQWQPDLPAFPDVGHTLGGFFENFPDLGSFFAGIFNKPDKPSLSELLSQFPSFGNLPSWPGSGGQGSGGSTGGTGGSSGGAGGGSGASGGSSGGTGGSSGGSGSSGSSGITGGGAGAPGGSSGNWGGGTGAPSGSSGSSGGGTGAPSGSSGSSGGGTGAPSGSSGGTGGGFGGPGSQGSSGGQGGSSGGSGTGTSGGSPGSFPSIQGIGLGGGSGSHGSGGLIPSGGSISWGGNQGSGGMVPSSGSISWGGSQGSGGMNPIGGSISWGGGSGSTGGSQGSGGVSGSGGSSGGGSLGGNIDGSQGGQGGGIAGAGGSAGSQGSGGNQGGSQGTGGSQGSGGQGGSSGSFPSGGSISWGGGSGGSQGSGSGQGGSSGSSGSGSSGGNIDGSQGGQGGGISGVGGSGGSQGSGGNQGGSQGSGGGQGGSSGSSGSGSWGGGSQGGGISWGGTTGGSQGGGGQGGSSGSFPSGGSISWGGGSGGSQGSGGGQGGSSGSSGSGSSGGNIDGSQGNQGGGIAGAGGSGGAQGSGGNQGGSQGIGSGQGGSSGSSGSGSWGGGSQGGGISWGGTTGGSQGNGGQGGSSGSFPSGGSISWGGGSGGSQGSGGGQGGSSGSSGSGSSGGNIDGSQGNQGGGIAGAGGSGGAQGSGGNQGGSQGIGSGQGGSSGSSGSGSWGGGSQGGGISWGGTTGGSQGSGGQGGSSGSFPSGGSIPWGGSSGGSQGSGGGQGGSSGSSGSGSSGGNIDGSQGGQGGGISGVGGSGGSQGSGGNQGGSQGIGSGQGGSSGSSGSGSWGGGSQGGGISWGGTNGGSQAIGGQGGSSGSFPSGGSISWGGGNQGGSQGSGSGQGGSSGSSGSGSWGGINGGSQGGGISWGGISGGSQGSGGSSGTFPSGGSISWGGGNQGGSQVSGNGQGDSSGSSGSFPSGGGIPWGGSSGGPQGTGGGQGGSSGVSGSGSWGGSGGSTGSNNVGSLGSGSGSSGANGPQGTGGSSSGSIGSSSSGGSASAPSGGNVPSTGGNGGLPSGSGSGSSGSSGNNESGSSGGTGSNPPTGGTSGGVGTLPGYPGGISWGGSSESGSSGSSGSGGSSGGGVSEIPSGGTIEWGGSPSNGQPGSSGGGSSSIGSSGSSGNLGGSSGTPGSAIIAGSGGGGGGTYAPKPSKSNAYASEAFLDRISMGGIAKGPEQALHEKSMEAKIIEILYNLRFSIPSTPLAPIQLDRHMIFLTRLSNEQLTILGLAKSIIPPPVRPDLISRTLGCLQGGSDFLGCTKAVVWPFLSLYIANLPVFPEENAAVLSMIIDRHASESDFVSETPVAPSPYSALIGQSFQLPYGHFLGQTVQIASRSPLRSEISAKADNQPIISVTDTRFVPIYSDHPETVILKILTAMADSIEQSNPPEYHSKVPAFITLHSTLNSTLNQEQESVIKIAEYLIPEKSRQAFFNSMLNCLVESNSFQFCSRNILWPALAEHYPRLPSFPNFQENLTENHNSLGEDAPIPISEIDVKTGQHGDTLVTITDTRFVPLFGEHPEEVIMKLLKGIHSSSPNQINTPASSIAKSPSFTSSFSSRQSDILVVAENLLPESIREIFIMRMTDCVRDNTFLDCTRDIAWPTIGQFFPRLASFPNFGTLPSLNEDKPQQPTLLPPNLEPTAPMSEMPRIVHPEAIKIQQTPESLESKIEGILNQIVLLRGGQQPGLSYLNTEDPITTAIITEEQARIIRTAEGLVPEAARPIFIVKMMDCIRGNGFPICTQAVAWPTLRQFLPNIPEFPGITNFVPELPSFSEFAANFPQLPALPNPQQFGLPQVQLHRNSLKSIQEVPGGQPEVLLPGYTASVGPAPVVPAFPGQPTDILIDISAERVTLPKVEYEIKRKRRQVINLLEEESNSEIDNNKVLEPLNITEPDLLQLLINITQAENEEPTEMPVLSVESLDSTNSSLTDEQTAILGMLDKLDFKNSRGLMSQVIGCITSLSFIRCIGIFVWPLITSAMGNLVPSLPGLPFGRATDAESDELFGSSIEDLEKELWARKEEVERKLLDWYKSLTEEKFEADYGLLRFVGYGDGEIGIKFGEGRQGRAKIKDHKHLPSILTIISEIMEDVLDTGRPNQKVKKDNKRGKSLVFPLTERSDNDDQIVGMFLDKLRSNLTDEDLKYGNRKLTPEDAYRAFEVLFGPRLRARLVNNIQQLYENNINENRMPLEQQEKKANLFNELEEDQEDLHRKKSALTIHLPKLDDEIISRKMTNSLAAFARKMDKTTMMQMAPGVGFLLTFFLQMALAHARAAASMATMMSNMAMGTAMFSLVRQTIFGDTNHPKIKYVYDTDVNAPGISWPHS